MRRSASDFDLFLEEDFWFFMKIFIKAADISHCGVEWKQHFSWCQRVLCEFYDQVLLLPAFGALFACIWGFTCMRLGLYLHAFGALVHAPVGPLWALGSGTTFWGFCMHLGLYLHACGAFSHAAGAHLACNSGFVACGWGFVEKDNFIACDLGLLCMRLDASSGL